MSGTAPDFIINQICDKLWQAWRSLSDVQHASQSNIPGSATTRGSIRQPRNAILDLLEDLHREHKPERYLDQDSRGLAQCDCLIDRLCPTHVLAWEHDQYPPYQEDCDYSSPSEEDYDYGLPTEEGSTDQAISNQQAVEVVHIRLTT
ncbi:hypothetical protein LTR86_004037 [Recurvomyces mirabilis]|nr:hypothetical protein LTR86_004037 [Recurvomyces mirabilis]